MAKQQHRCRLRSSRCNKVEVKRTAPYEMIDSCCGYKNLPRIVGAIEEGEEEEKL